MVTVFWVSPPESTVLAIDKPTKPRLQPNIWKPEELLKTPEASGAGIGDGDARRDVAGTDTQRMLFHAPDGASGTLATSVAVEVAVGSAAGDAVAVAADDADTDADAFPVWLASGEFEGEPLAVAPTQPAATNAVSAMTALHLRQQRPLKNLDSTALPSG